VALEQLVRAHCEKRLGTIKRPVRYVVIQELPRSAAGKMLKYELRAPFWAGRSRHVN
jgi:acyl-CoA synthetase (AMP-forming)/AMP-acid ligase II